MPGNITRSSSHRLWFGYVTQVPAHCDSPLMNHLQFLHVPLARRGPKVEHCSSLTLAKKRGITTYFNLSAVLLLMQLSACFAPFAMIVHFWFIFRLTFNITPLLPFQQSCYSGSQCLLHTDTWVYSTPYKELCTSCSPSYIFCWPNTHVSQCLFGSNLCCLVCPPFTPSTYYNLQICGSCILY